MTTISPSDVVVGCLRGDDARTLGAGEWSADDVDRIAALAAQHLVEPAVHRVIGPFIGDSDAADSLAAAARRNGLDQLKSIADLARVANVLDQLSVAWVVLKGPALAEVYYPRPEWRSYADLDVLVDPSRFGDVIDALETAGAALIDVNWDLIRDSGRGEVSLRLWQGTELDLHWHPITEARTRRRFPVTTPHLLERRTRRTIAGSQLPILGPGDQLSYVATHAVLAGADRLRWYVDVAMILERDGPPSAAAWRRSECQGFALPTAIMIDRVARVLQQPVAQHATSAAPRAMWRTMMRGAAFLRPPEQVVADQLALRTIARSSRATTGQSLASAAESVWIDVIRPFITEPQHPWRTRLRGRPAPGSGGNPLHSPGGTDMDRAAYLSWVAGHGNE